MTLVIAHDTTDGIVMVADTQATDLENATVETRLDSKLFYNSGVLYGFSGSYRIGQLLRFLPLPKISAKKFAKKSADENSAAGKSAVESNLRDLWSYMVTVVVPALQEAAQGQEQGEEWEVLAAYGHEFVRIDQTGAVAQTRGNYTAIGIASQYAMGALDALDSMDFYETDTTLIDLGMIVQSASRRNVAVGPYWEAGHRGTVEPGPDIYEKTQNIALKKYEQDIRNKEYPWSLFEVVNGDWITNRTIIDD